MIASLTDRKLLKRLVSFDTTSVNSNLPIADFICEYIEGDGVRIERHPNEDGSKTNLLILAGPEPVDGEGLLLSGHMDVVPAVEPEWETNPFELVEMDGDLYARGSADMKGFNALAINIFEGIDRNALTKPLGLLLTYDEELGTLGAQHFANGWPKDRQIPKSVLVGEPTSLKAVRMHKGHLTIRIDLRGVSAHSGSPHLGRNAIEPAGEIITRLIAVQDELKRQEWETGPCFSEVPYPVLSVTTIEGGSAVNIVPDLCVLHVSIRLMPGQTSPSLIERVGKVVGQVMEDRSHKLSVVNESPPVLLDEDTEICRELCSIIGQSETYGVTYASDAGPFQQTLGMECILYGPGTIDVAHKPNERLPIAEFNRARGVVDQLVQRMCMA